MEITRIKLSEDDIYVIKFLSELEHRKNEIISVNIGTIEFNIKITDSEDKNKYLAYNEQGNEVEIENLDLLIQALN